MFCNIRSTCLAILFLSIVCTGKVTNADETLFTLATASKGGTYHPVGEALATLTKVKLQTIEKIGLTAMNTAGSKDNIKLLRENKAQFAILQGLYGYYAWNGQGPIAEDGPQKEIRSISMLWKNVEHFVVAKEKAKSGTIEDMAAFKGAKVSLGQKGSGTIGSNGLLLKNMNIDPDNTYELMYAGYGQSVNALRVGEIEGMATPAGVPAMAVSYAFRSMPDKITLLSFTEEQARQADGGLGLWIPYLIPANTYPGLDKDVMTIAQPNFLAVRADIDENAVYRITKLIFENLHFLQNIHAATLEMSPEKALDGLPIPLHPGAARFYKEIGLNVPDNLIAQ